MKNLLHFKPFAELEYNEWLSPLAIQFLDNWRTLNDDTSIYDLLLKTVRSLNSRYRSHLQPKTETREKYELKNIDWELTVPGKFNVVSTTMYVLYSLIPSPKKEDYNAVFKQKLKKDQRKADILKSKGA